VQLFGFENIFSNFLKNIFFWVGRFNGNEGITAKGDFIVKKQMQLVV